jgi:hypothetical protein
MHDIGTVCVKTYTNPYICFDENIVIIRGCCELNF